MDAVAEPGTYLRRVLPGLPLLLSLSSTEAPEETPDEPDQQDDPPPVGYDARPRSGRCTQ